ncbi:MAG TPA: hypothetical protein VNB46_02290 [Gaiellaceae bacterium]|nr:hypothetical protein [Gaiellaceae bacterium]
MSTVTPLNSKAAERRHAGSLELGLTSTQNETAACLEAANDNGRNEGYNSPRRCAGGREGSRVNAVDSTICGSHALRVLLLEPVE